MFSTAATTIRIVRTVPRLSQACLPATRVLRPTIPSICVPAAQHLPTVHHQTVRWYASKKAKGGKGAQKKAGKEEAEPEISPKAEVVELKFDEQQVVKKMNQVSDWLKKDLSGIRIGRANPALLEGVSVSIEQSHVPLHHITQITVKDPQTLLVILHEPDYLSPVEKAIREAGLNLNPISDGKNLKVPIPKPTKEHRDNMVKIANKAAEQARTRIRSVRQDGMKDLKKDQKAGLSEDEVKKMEKQVQKYTDSHVKEIDDILKSKTKEITSA
ncbi:ribosome recycling factor domain-containing protein [Umbelopsis sp. AD052]|nr:ribosome recycling factor domain-containing protein [Umbelopsis sp. AD052]